MENEKKLVNDNKRAEIAAHLDETQIVSLKDLEELEYLQLTGGSEAEVAARRRSVPLGAVFGVLLALLLVGVLTAGYVFHERSSIGLTHSGSR